MLLMIFLKYVWTVYIFSFEYEYYLPLIDYLEVYNFLQRGLFGEG